MAQDNFIEMDGRLEEALLTFEEQIQDLTQSLRAIQKRVRAGEIPAVTDANKTCTEIRGWVKFAAELKEKLHERHGHAGNGRAGGEEIDLDAVRNSIGCRLNRLRACGYTG